MLPRQPTNMNLREKLCRRVQGKVVVMGIGNPSRGDDAAGSCVAQQICSAPAVHIIDAQDVPENYLCQVADRQPDTVVLIDCVDLKSAPGSVALLEKDETMAYWPSTHRVPMGLIVNYLEGTTDARILLIGIQPQQTDFLQPISADVLSSVEVVARVLNEIFESRRISASVQGANPLTGEVPA
ncbi:MAG: hydrogenase 3 maturation endopeptidase HyCI [Candidatus Sulfotelmatobacter sp.]